MDLQPELPAQYPQTNQPALQELLKHPVPELGLVCITTTDEVRYRTITRTNYLKLDPSGRFARLRELYADNLQRMHKALLFCARRQIRLYRMTSGLFPMSDLEGDTTGPRVMEELGDELAQVGRLAAQLGIRVVIHPDQFIVLSSDSPRIIENSVRALENHARILDMMGLPVTAWTAMTIHGGKGDRLNRLVETIGQLAPNIRQRLTLENDEDAYGAEQILEACRRAGVAMVFDVHHHICHEGLTDLNDPDIARVIAAARDTWPDPAWQLVHLSSGRDRFADPAHHDYILAIPDSYRQVPWIEVEAKNKELAIEKLRLDWNV